MGLNYLHVCFAWNYVDVKQEKQHSQLIQGVENFKPDQLKRTSTLEKIVLPNAQGNLEMLVACFIQFAF